MKHNFFWSILAAAALAFGGCEKSSDDTEGAVVKLTTETSGPVLVVPGKQIGIPFEVGGGNARIEIQALPEGWSAQVDDETKRIVVTAGENACPKATLTLSAAGSARKASLEMVCLNTFDDPKGTFVLNEGNMTSENGSLTYIAPEGAYVIKDAYSFVNGSELGNVAQDMAACNGKIYVISQNGNGNGLEQEQTNDGMLVIMEAKTLKKVAAFSKEELPGLDWPSHIAVIDDSHIYIRDNKGIYRFDAQTKRLSFVKGSEKAPKCRFVTMDGKVYTYLPSGVNLPNILEISPEKDEVKRILLPEYGTKYDCGKLGGIQPIGAGKIWVLSIYGKAAIGKFDLATRKIVQHQISFKPTVGSSGVAFVTHGDKVYYADGTSVYRLEFSETEDNLDKHETELVDVALLDPDAGMRYNGLGVHPVTGHLYVNTIKSFALYSTNQIWQFDADADPEKPVAKYLNQTSFPAGFFFPGNF